MPKRSFISALFYSIRPSACLGIALFAIAGQGRWDDLFVSTLTFASAFIGGAGCFLINDIFDREKDLKNNQLRPIATGEIPVRPAFIVSVICCSTMLVSAVFLTLNTVILATFLITAFWLYPYINQRFGLLANIWVSVCSALAFLYGALVYDVTALVYLAMLSTFFVNAAREILLDSLDQAGDQAVGKCSIPLVYGENRTKTIVSIFFGFGSIVLLVYLRYFPATWPWIIILLLMLWIPFFMKKNEGFNKWALFNVRTSHLFFITLIVLLFIRPENKLTAQPVITAEYCLDKLEKIQSKKDGFYPIGVFPSQRYWLSQEAEEDNNIFSTSSAAYILRSTDERRPNKRARAVVNLAVHSFEKYRSRRGKPTYNFWQSGPDHMPFPNSILLARDPVRLPDDYDDTALIQLARGDNTMDQSVRNKMVEFAMRPDRKVVEHFPSEFRYEKVYEVSYVEQMQQELDIAVMANVLLFVMEKGYPLETPDRQTLECLKTSIDEGWYFKDPRTYAQYYGRTAVILYYLTRLVAKDHTGHFKAQRVTLIRHLRQALAQTDQAIEKVMLASSLLRLGEPVRLDLSVNKVMKDAQLYPFFCFIPTLFNMRIVPTLYWRSEAVSWSLVYELFSFDQTAIRWK
jgi:4-hydroxybenzoate polyprenyltransferase